MKGTFLTNKYTRWYLRIIKSAKNKPRPGYLEKHHIIPFICGGKRGGLNAVRLTPREHYVCHRLLTKMTQGDKQEQLVEYFKELEGSTSREYEVLRLRSVV
jgi:hypothetical protein